MSRTIMLIPANVNNSIFSISLGIAQAMKNEGINLYLFKLISMFKFKNQIFNNDINHSNDNSNIDIIELTKIKNIENLFNINKQNLIIKKIISEYYKIFKKSETILIEGISLNNKYHFSSYLNYKIASILNADIIFVFSINKNSFLSLKKEINLLYYKYKIKKNKNLIGIIFNKLNFLINYKNKNFFNSNTNFLDFKKYENNNNYVPILGYVPFNKDIVEIKIIDIINFLNAKIIYEGQMYTNRIKNFIFCSEDLSKLLNNFSEELLLIIPSSRLDILFASCLALINKIKIGAILLIENNNINLEIFKLYKKLFKKKLSLFSVKADIKETLIKLQNFNLEILSEDFYLINKLKNYTAKYINKSWIKSFVSNSKHKKSLSSSIFCYHLIKLAQKSKKRIVLPEGYELRTLKAASFCEKNKIAHCILLGDPYKINQKAKINNIKLENNIEIINPNLIRHKYIYDLIKLRKHKGITNKIIAYEQLKDNVVLATMMLKKNEVDGLVSGALNTTANTIRPSLQIIKIDTGSTLISSIFFMLLPKQILIFGDCAININPNPDQLSEIAIQSANSAIEFGIEPRIAMISYSTGNSGSGESVDKVLEATKIVKNKRPDLIIDGPLQYDAAISHEIASIKAPDSPVAGNATILIFPDLNTGNSTYKAVQQSANIISIGPIIQGMKKPVNDLSRGAKLKDIIYTIAITAIQAKQKNNY